MFGDLDWALNMWRDLSAIAEFLVMSRWLVQPMHLRSTICRFEALEVWSWSRYAYRPAKRFLPRDAMGKRGLCCRPVSVRLSVRMSRWWIVSRRLKISPNFFLGQVAPSVFFYPQRRYPILRGPPLSGAKNTRGWGKFALSTKITFISETVRDRSMVAMKR